MFRLVTQGVEKPAFLMLCDNIECGMTTTAEAITSHLNPVPLPQQEMAFLEQCKRSGWFVSMRLSLCPGHYKMLHDAAAATQKKVQGIGGQGGAGFTAE